MEHIPITNYSDNVMMTSPSNATNMSTEVEERLLDAKNLRETIKYVPVLAFYIFIMIVGLIGNSFVLYIYKIKFNRTSARTYILCLALLDFLVCCVGLPYHTLDLTHLLTYYHTEVCRALSFLSGAVNLGSVFVLMVVAVDRYLKICRPLKKQVVDFGNRRACAIAIITAIIISIPNAILYGESSVETSANGFNLTGIECFIDDEYAETTFAVAYLGFYFLVFIICVLTLIILYTFICREIYRNQAFHSQDASSKCVCLSCASANDLDTDSDYSVDQTDVLTMATMSAVVSEDDRLDATHAVEHLDIIKEEPYIGRGDNFNSKNEAAKSEEVKNHGATESLLRKPERAKTRVSTKVDSPVSKKRSTKYESRKQSKHKSVKPLKSNALVRHTSKGATEKHTRKITLMMLTITVVFIISYLPFIIISLADSLDSEYWKDMPEGIAVFVDVMLRFYLINNMANAIIYSFWDERFRRECIIIIRKLFCCKTQQKFQARKR